MTRLLALVLVGLCASACAVQPEPPALVIAGEGAYADVMEAMGSPPLDDALASRLANQRLYGGGRGGALGPMRVRKATNHGCANLVIHVAPAAVLQPFAAYSRPAEFYPLERWPTGRDEVLRQASEAIGVKGDDSTPVVEQLWRFKVPDRDWSFVLAILHSAGDWEKTATGEIGDIDALFLFRESGGTLTLLDKIVWVVETDDGWRVLPEPMALATNPFDGRIELFVQYRFYEGYQVTVFDIGDGRLQSRGGAVCSF